MKEKFECMESIGCNNSCFVECNVKEINRKIFENLLSKINFVENLIMGDSEKEMKLHQKKKDFHKRFMSLCMDFEKDCNDIIESVKKELE